MLQEQKNTQAHTLFSMNVPQNQEQIQNIPFVLIIVLILLSSLAGELYRADKQQRITKAMLVRVLIRSFASTMIGIIACLYCLHKGMDSLAVGAITGGVSMIGADVVIAVWTIIFKRKLGV